MVFIAELNKNHSTIIFDFQIPLLDTMVYKDENSNILKNEVKF